MNFKKLFKLAFKVIIIVLVLYLIYNNYYLLSNKLEYVYSKYFSKGIRQTLVDNKYRKKENYEYLKIYEDTNIKNEEDIKNAIYTFLDAGWQRYTIKCDPDYESCVSDVKKIVENNTYLTDISNFVHPFNTFNKVNTSFNSTGKITLKKESRYTDEQIKKISDKVDEIYNNNYDPSKNVRENIKIFHDYIINNTKYDSNNTTGLSDINSSTAYGVLFDGVGICSGYADTISLFLDKMNVKNYRISSNTHVWNLVYLEGSWWHLDLTWDDPLTTNGQDMISDKYFLIDTNTLMLNLDSEHQFNQNIYKEAK